MESWITPTHPDTCRPPFSLLSPRPWPRRPRLTSPLRRGAHLLLTPLLCRGSSVRAQPRRQKAELRGASRLRPHLGTKHRHLPHPPHPPHPPRRRLPPPVPQVVSPRAHQNPTQRLISHAQEGHFSAHLSGPQELGTNWDVAKRRPLPRGEAQRVAAAGA